MLEYPERSASALMLFIVLIFFGTGTLQAQEPGVINGSVTDPSGEFGLEDARVTIQELNRTTTTNGDGSFRFASLSPGAYTLTVDYIGFPTLQREVRVAAGEARTVAFALGQPADAETDGVLLAPLMVEGQFAGRAAALNQERSATGIVEVISADEVGDFPDQNVAEALARVPGISVLRDQGEGRFAVIRGLGPEFNTVTINGLRVPAPEAGTRAVNLDVISSDLVESVTVTKSLTPDMDADAIGGNVEIETLTAFDLGNSLTFTGEGSYDEVSDEVSPRGSVTATRLFSDSFGVAGSFNYYDREFATHNIESGGWPFRETLGGRMVRSATDSEQRDYELNRKRYGGTLSFDFRPNENSEYYLRTVYSSVEEGENEIETPYLFEDGTVVQLSEDGGTFEDGVVERVGKSSTGTQEIFTLSVGGENVIDIWTLDYRAGYAFANDDVPDTVEAGFVGEGLTIGYDISDDFQAPDIFTGSAGADPGSYALDYMENEFTFTEETETTLEFNASRFTEFWSHPGLVSLGVQARLRDKFNEKDLTVYDSFGGDFTLADFNADVDYPLGTFGPAPDNAALRDFLGANRDAFGINPGETAIESRAEDYDFEENIYAAYLMAEAEIDKLYVLTGLRVEHTETEQSGTRFTLDENINDGFPTFDPVAADGDYTDFFPNLQAVYRFNDRWQLRGTLTRTIARPGFEDASTRQAIEIEGVGADAARVAEVGNPDLEPVYSNNVDLELSYYPPGSVSVYSAGVFYKAIDDFFVSTDVAGQPGFENFEEVSQVINGDEATVYGLELNAIRQLNFLPAPWDGLLIAANYSYIESAAKVPFRDEDIRLPGQPNHIANLSLGYDKGPLAMRLAAKYRDEYFGEVNEPDDASQDRYADDNLRLDFHGEYRFAENYTALFNVINITEEPGYYYLGDERYNSQYDAIGTTYEMGLRVRF